MSEVRNLSDLHRWAAGRPTGWAQAIALRSALRVLPLIAEYPTDQTLHLATLRAAWTAWVIHRFQTPFGTDISESAEAVNRAVALAAVGKKASDPPQYRARTAARAIAIAGGGGDVAIAVGAASDAATMSGDRGQTIWSQVGKDCASLDQERATFKNLFDSPLWSGKPPAWSVDALGKFDTTMMRLDPNAKLWITWLSLRQTGSQSAFGLTLEKEKPLVARVAAQDKSFWDQSPPFINATIAHWIEEAREEEGEHYHGFNPDFFISYAASDEAMAREIVSILEQAGYVTLAQFRDFTPGTNFVREMQRGLASSGRLIALLSSAYEESPHCQAEWAAAYIEDPGSESGKIVPFLIEPTKLNPLANQIVYRSLVGMDVARRREAVLDAVRHRPRRRSRSEVQRDAAQLASPDVAVLNGKLDAVPNRDTDTPVGQADLADLVVQLREQSSLANDVLPDNAPKLISACLVRYNRHLAERRAQPILGLLDNMVAPVRAEFTSSEMMTWGVGIEHIFRALFTLHEELHGHFPKSDRREQFFSETPINEAKASGEALGAPIREVREALVALSDAGATTKDFDHTLKGQVEAGEDLASLVPPADLGPTTIVTPKRRWLLSFIGFCERSLSSLSNLSSLAKGSDSAVIQTAIEQIARAIEKLLDLIH